MEGVTLFVALIYLVSAILGVVLFCKIWKMTNRVKEISDKIEKSDKNFEELLHILRRIEYQLEKKNQ